MKRPSSEELMALADELCDGRLVCVLEGGYHLDVLAHSVLTTLRVDLIELRRIIYAEIKRRALPKLDQANKQGFALQQESGLQFQLDLPKAQLDDLLLMTPHLFRASHEGKQRVNELEQIDLTVDVSFRRLQLTHTKDHE